jgi:WNK lysine deficient protein kinase
LLSACSLTALSTLSLHMLCKSEIYDLRHGTADFHRAAQELLQEARLLQSLRHDNIVTLRGVTMHPEHGHVQWLVTERASGDSLEAWLSARGVLTLEELLDLLRSVMRALVYLHSRTPSVLHRDVKPANVLVFETFGGGIVWKLGDVGIAKVLQSTARARTQAGTPMYTAADVLLGPYDGRVDVFSTGIMAAELVVRHMGIGGFDRVPASTYRDTQHRAAMVDDACRRLERVCPAMAAVV